MAATIQRLRPSDPRALPKGAMPRPWVRFKRVSGSNGPTWETTLSLQVEPGVWMHWAARVSEKEVLAALKAAGVEVEIGNFFKSIAKGVGKIAKITGADKVLKIASFALHNPLVQGMVPGLGLAAKAMDGARGLLTASVAAKKGDPRAKQALVYAAQQLKDPGGNPVAQQSAALASRIYRIAVMPG